MKIRDIQDNSTSAEIVKGSSAGGGMEIRRNRGIKKFEVLKMNELHHQESLLDSEVAFLNSNCFSLFLPSAWTSTAL